MAVLQENIFDIVKRAKTKDFRTELSGWQKKFLCSIINLGRFVS